MEGTSKRPLEGTTVFVTGGRRDIGRSIVDSAVSEGAIVRSCYLRDRQTQQLDAALDFAASVEGDLKFKRADITNWQGRRKIYQVWERDFGREPDVLVLSASGPDRKINVLAPRAMINKMLSYRRERLKRGEELTQAEIVLIESVPGMFATQLEDAGLQMGFYGDTGRNKHEGWEELKAREDELAELKVNYFQVCPPKVPESSNWQRFIKRVGRTSDEDHSKITKAFGLPDAVPMDDVGKKVAKLIMNPPHAGYTEFFNGVRDAKVALSPWFGSNISLPDTFDPSRGLAWMLATKKHTEGHFQRKPVVPAFYLEEAATQAFVLMVSDGNLSEDQIPLLPERRGKLEYPVRPGDAIRFETRAYDADKRRDYKGEVNLFLQNRDDRQIGTVYVDGRVLSLAAFDRLFKD